MAYLHCHNCGWSQDDFWEYKFKWKEWKDIIRLKWSSRPLGYNPISILLEDIAYYWRPRIIKMDSYWAKERGLKNNYVYSWWFIGNAFKRYWQVKKNMLYKTWDDFSKDKKEEKAKCPKCKSMTDWDID